MCAYIHVHVYLYVNAQGLVRLQTECLCSSRAEFVHTCNSSILQDICDVDTSIIHVYLAHVGMSLRLELAGFVLSPEIGCEHLTAFFEVVGIMQRKSVAELLVLSKSGHGCRTFSEFMAAASLISTGLQRLLANLSGQVNAYQVELVTKRLLTWQSLTIHYYRQSWYILYFPSWTEELLHQYPLGPAAEGLKAEGRKCITKACFTMVFMSRFV